MKQLRIAVVGGGAAGLVAAITASRGGAKVDIWERNDRVGKKILATGNGKCNFANLDLDIDKYNGEALQIPQTVLQDFDARQVQAFFEDLGMLCRTKDSLLYPYSEQASTVLDVLRFAVLEQGIGVLTEQLVTEVKPLADGTFQVCSKNQSKIYDRVILTCGGMAAPKTGSDGKGYVLAKSLGHKVTTVCPGLTGLKAKDKDFKAISGVRSQAKVTLLIDDKVEATEKGELQLTDYGISGIAVFQISRKAGMALLSKRKVTVALDICPDMDLQTLKLLLQRKKNQFKDREVEAFLSGFVNKKLGMYLAKKASISMNQKMGQVKEESLYAFAKLCKNFEVQIVETNTFEQAQVTAGGVSFAKLDETLQSKLHKGLYFAGELLDVDGKCGGYNLQWAWSSGFVAGSAAAKN